VISAAAAKRALGSGAVGSGEECDGFVVVVSPGMLAESGAADHVGGDDAGVNGQRRAGVGDGTLVVGEGSDGLGRRLELVSLGQSTGSGGVVAVAGPSRAATSLA
jgi:hypothetical protein